jgi:hypothetical protein
MQHLPSSRAWELLDRVLEPDLARLQENGQPKGQANARHRRSCLGATCCQDSAGAPDRSDMRPENPGSALPPQSVGHEATYSNVIDVQFVSRALASGARCLRGVRWATREQFPGDAPDVLASAYYNYNRSFEALTEVGGALAHVIRHGDNVTVRLAAGDQRTLDEAERKLRARLPEPESDTTLVPVEFSYWREQTGVVATSRTLEVPRLDEIALNYPTQVRAALAELAGDRGGARGGRLILWHGRPGCGKTWALRAGVGVAGLVSAALRERPRAAAAGARLPDRPDPPEARHGP